jgi:signal transduction histidine kinase/ActR/RegA family two-component response regulator
MPFACDNRTDAILTAVLESTDDLICALDTKNLGVLTFNTPMARHFATKFGKRIDVGTRLEDVFDAEAVTTWRRLILRAVNEGPYSMEHRGLIEGQVFWVSFNRLLAQGHCFGISIFARDITAFEQAIGGRKRLEEEATLLRAHLEQAQRMDSLRTLADGIAHDFNNILGAVRGYAETVLLRTQDPSIRPLLENIEGGASRAMDLVRQIHAFSRQAPQDKRPVEVAGIAKEAMVLIRAALPASIEITQRYDSTASVLADPMQIHHVVMNLCTNAGLAMHGNTGTLELAITEREPDARLLAQHPWLEPRPHVCVKIRDNGCGIPAEILPRIFEPFFTTRQPGEGTGLGLSVVYGIVKDAGGIVTATSTPGVGSTFEVILPVCAPADVEKATVHAPTPPDTTTNVRVLFIDDEPALVTLTVFSLEQLGFKVTAFANPAEAIREFERRPADFDILVTDLAMPNITGEALGLSIRKLRPDIPIILMSGNLERLARDRVHATGADLCLAKPFRPTELAQAIRGLCPEPAVKKSGS